jgi:hypothetical protein
MTHHIDLIDLQSAHATQLTNSGIRGDWVIKKNITGESLQAFPGTIDDSTMFGILNFAKEYELIAFNEGIKFQKGKDNEFLSAQIKTLKGVNQELADENIRLASILENLIPEE